jgi:hypothetical protein
MTAHAWLSSSGQFDVCSRKGCYWQRRINRVSTDDILDPFAATVGELVQYRTARTDWRPLAEPPCPGKDVDPRERAIVGALRSAIEAHGPITAEHIGSAAKRILGNLKNVGESRKAE